MEGILRGKEGLTKTLATFGAVITGNSTRRQGKSENSKKSDRNSDDTDSNVARGKQPGEGNEGKKLGKRLRKGNQLGFHYSTGGEKKRLGR